MVDTEEMFRSREFRTSDLDTQRESLASANSGFASLGTEEQDQILREVEDQYGRSFYEGEFDAAFDRGVAKAFQGFTHAGVNAVDMLTHSGSPGSSKGVDRKSDLEMYLRDVEQDFFEQGINPEGKSTHYEVFGEMAGIGAGTVIGFGGTIMGAALGLVATGMSWPAALSAAAVGSGFALGSLSAADQGFLESMKAGTTMAAFTALFPALRAAGVGPAGGAAVLGPISFLMTPEEMELNERVGHGLLGSIFGAANGIGVKPRYIYRDPRATGKATMERIKPKQLTEIAESLEPEIGGKLLAEKGLTRLNDRRGAEIAEREQIANDRLAYPKDEAKAAELEKQIESLPPEERAMMDEIRSQEQAADATRGTEIGKRIEFLKLEWARIKDPKSKAFIEHEIRNLEQQPRLDGKPVEKPVEKEASSPREEGEGQGDLSTETTRGRAAPEEPGEPPKLPEGDTGKGFRGEYETFRGEFEEKFGKMGEYPDEQLPPGGGEGVVPAEETVPVIHRSTGMDRKRLEYLDDGHGFMWMERKSGMEDMPENVWHHFQTLRGIPDFQDGMVKWGVPGWIEDPLIPGQRIIRYQDTPRFDVIEHEPAPGDAYQGKIYEAVERTEAKYPKINDRVHQGMGQVIGPIMAKGRRYESDSWDYFQARRSNELINQMIDPRTGDIRQATMEEILELKTREKNWDLETIEEHLAKANPERVAVYASMKAYANQFADFLVDTGFVTKSSRDQWAVDNMEYAFGFNRQMQAGKNNKHRREDRLTTAMGIHRLHGSKKDLRDRYTLFINGKQDLAKAALQNKFVMETVDKMIALGGFAERISPSAKRIVVGKRALKQALIDDMVANEGLSEVEAAARLKWIGEMPGDIEQLAFFVGGNTPYGTDVASFLRNGRPEYYKIYDPVIQRSLQSMNRDAMIGILGRALAGFKRFKQEMITIDPTFIYRNVIRDPAMGTMTTRTGQQALSGALKSVNDVLRESQDFKDYIANGGGGATLRDGVRLSRKRIIAQAERANRSWANPRNLLFGPGDMWRFLKATGKAGEQLTRLGQFKEARKSGIKGPRKGEPATMQESVVAGKEVSTNFSIRGGGKPTSEDAIFGTSWGPAANKFMADTVPFFNAMLASTDRMYRATFRDPHGKTGTAFKMGMVGINSMFLYAFNRWLAEKYGHLLDEDDRPYVDFLNIPDWARMTQWDFYIPYEFDAETLEPIKFHHFHTPKLWEVGTIGSVAERFAQYMMDGSEDDKEMFWDMVDIVAHNFNFKTQGKGLPFPAPAGIDIGLEQGMNRILFTGQPIETRGMGEIKPWARGRSATPRTLQAFSESLRNQPWVPDIIESPSRAEALLRSIFGSWATMGLQVTDQVFFPGGPALGWDDLPVIRSIYSEPGKYDRNAELFYNNLELFNQARGTQRDMENREKYKIADEMDLDPDQAYQIEMAPQYDRANRRLQLINREIDELKRGVGEPFASPKELHHMINKLIAERNQWMKELNEDAALTKKEYQEEARASGN